MITLNATEAKNKTDNYCCEILSEIADKEIETAIKKQNYSCDVYFYKKIDETYSYYDMFIANETKFYTKMTDLGYVVSHTILIEPSLNTTVYSNGVKLTISWDI